MKSIFTLTCTYFLIVSFYFCLWVVSNYLLLDPVLALLFFPFSLRLGIVLHTNKRYWIPVYFSEFTVLFLITPKELYVTLFFISLMSIVFSYIFSFFKNNKNNNMFLYDIFFVLFISAFNSIFFVYKGYFYVFLVNFTGLLLIIPFCYLLNDFLFNRRWIPITSRLVSLPVSFRIKHILIYALFFILNITIQTYLPNEFFRFSLFFLSIPIIILSIYYEWKGAIIASLINSISLMATIHNFSHIQITDVFLSISLQTIIGIFLGLNIQKQNELNKSLKIELKNNQNLTRKLIDTENNIRKEVSQELHDEIGQNITAIRTQAMILKRINPKQENIKITDTIDKLSLNIYDSVKGILNRIRPRVLDDLKLMQSIQNLFIEMGFEQRNIRYKFDFKNDKGIILDNLLEVTIYRICQESLNNIIKHSQATSVYLYISIDNMINIIIEDNGVGIDKSYDGRGLGLVGLKERICILNGDFTVKNLSVEGKKGTKIVVNLPGSLL
ncbi:signal transduction histidine-protein kinase/phosphatase UhpB [Otariodibacter sp.]|uniref:signal transduction histidine-protein kinase/phosphatase UhpB n=1 Tax=Otariodibacter sp. TaxID=3030919 RepID=UPI00263A17D5|nr:signal transduction histidine-protein kinase/phosphatase UhpB [Otariodibacter sp.]